MGICDGTNMLVRKIEGGIMLKYDSVFFQRDVDFFVLFYVNDNDNEMNKTIYPLVSNC